MLTSRDTVLAALDSNFIDDSLNWTMSITCVNKTSISVKVVSCNLHRFSQGYPTLYVIIHSHNSDIFLLYKNLANTGKLI